jgi:hypothetical protein
MLPTVQSSQLPLNAYDENAQFLAADERNAPSSGKLKLRAVIEFENRNVVAMNWPAKKHKRHKLLMVCAF